MAAGIHLLHIVEVKLRGKLRAHDMHATCMHLIPVAGCQHIPAYTPRYTGIQIKLVATEYAHGRFARLIPCIILYISGTCRCLFLL